MTAPTHRCRWMRCGCIRRARGPAIRCRTHGLSAKVDRIPLCDLVNGGRFVLLAGENGAAWVQAANKIAADHGIPLAGRHGGSARRRLRRRARGMA